MLQKGGAAERLNFFICAVRQGDAMTLLRHMQRGLL